MKPEFLEGEFLAPTCLGIWTNSDHVSSCTKLVHPVYASHPFLILHIAPQPQSLLEQRRRIDDLDCRLFRKPYPVLVGVFQPGWTAVPLPFHAVPPPGPVPPRPPADRPRRGQARFRYNLLFSSIVRACTRWTDSGEDLTASELSRHLPRESSIPSLSLEARR